MRHITNTYTYYITLLLAGKIFYTHTTIMQRWCRIIEGYIDFYGGRLADERDPRIFMQQSHVLFVLAAHVFSFD